MINAFLLYHDGLDLAVAFILRQPPAAWACPQGLQAHQPFDPVQAAFDASVSTSRHPRRAP